MVTGFIYTLHCVTFELWSNETKHDMPVAYLNIVVTLCHNKQNLTI
jgi:hypothetical protein